jgi:uncharacterized metal-binding protein
MGTECCQRRQALIVACSGASDLGALTDQAAREGRAHMSCLAGIGAGLSNMVRGAAAADALVVIDGCGVACGSHCVEKAGIANYTHIQLELLGKDARR